MDSLPDELVLQILSYLEAADVVAMQAVSQRSLNLARDNDLWKEECFARSRLESRRRREQMLAAQGSSLVTLRHAVSTLPENAFPLSQHGESTLPPGTHVVENARRRARASWDPIFPSEKLDFYREYIHRHADINVEWIHDAVENKTNSRIVLEATGMAVIPEHSKIVAPLDDGSVCMWDINSSGSNERNFMRSSSGLLPTGQSSRLSVLETAAVETVAVNSAFKRVYIASGSQLSELDLQTLQITGHTRFPGPITALSESRGSTPMTVGTSSTLHQFDFRARTFPTALDVSLSCELIAGTPPRDNPFHTFSNRRAGSTVSLPQPGPLSILHVPSYPGSVEASNDIWVAGRFTSLLNYDRRFWPRIRGTTFSGARLSSLCALPFPHVTRDYDLTRNPHKTLADLKVAKATKGFTLVGAGEYKGRGSLELYGLPASEAEHINGLPKQQALDSGYQNRQTSARSRLLSVSPHGASLVTSDGDGNLKWMERDGSTEVRVFNINEAGSQDEDPEQQLRQRSNLFGNAQGAGGDIVQKICTVDAQTSVDNLLIWTGDGRVGLVEFGRRRRPHDPSLEAAADAAHESYEERAERLYGQGMRRALEVQADETRFMRGLGMRMGF